MARRLKVFRTHLGFYDMIVAAPSQKAAAQAWGADRHVFAQGFAKVTTDPKLVEAALAKPGVVLRRQFGSDAGFSENPSLISPPSGSKAEAPRRKRKEQAAPEAGARKKAKERADRTAADRRKRAERRATEEKERKEQKRKKAAADREEQRAAKARAKAEAVRRREEERAAAKKRRDLQAQLDRLMRQRDDQLENIGSRKAKLEAERRKTEQQFETQILAVRKQIEST